MTLTRRAALAGLGLTAGCASSLPSPYGAAPQAGRLFRHGVASGDPLTDRVILWTRVTPAPGEAAMPVTAEMSGDPHFVSLTASVHATASADSDWTVKTDITGLEPGRTYFYRFRAGGETSPVGRTRTLPEGPVERVRLAAVSCANHALGYFNVYGAIAADPDFDAVIHLGDYIYEYGPGGYEGAPREIEARLHEPPCETVSLSEYRARHAQYKRDPALQAMHAAHPVIAIWDDHEFANNVWMDGADKVGETGKDWQDRCEAGLRAWYEWQPVREPLPGASRRERYGAVRFGDLACLHLLETRLSARSRPLAHADLAGTVASEADARHFIGTLLADPAREKVGAQQLERLAADMHDAKAGGVVWPVIASATLMASVAVPDLRPYLSEDDRARLIAEWSQGEGFLVASDYALPVTLDGWDGYPAERERLYEAIRKGGGGEVLVLSGDTHAWWANELRRADGSRAGYEFATASVTATAALGEETVGKRAADLALLVNRDNEDVRYVSGRSHGYADLTLTRDRADIVFRAVKTVGEPSGETYREAVFKVEREDGRLDLKSRAGLGLREWWLF